MLSKQGMFDAIQELRNELNRHHDIINSFKCQYLWNIYKNCTRKAEFKAQAKGYLNW